MEECTPNQHSIRLFRSNWEAGFFCPMVEMQSLTSQLLPSVSAWNIPLPYSLKVKPHQGLSHCECARN